MACRKFPPSCDPVKEKKNYLFTHLVGVYMYNVLTNFFFFLYKTRDHQQCIARENTTISRILTHGIGQKILVKCLGQGGPFFHYEALIYPIPLFFCTY